MTTKQKQAEVKTEPEQPAAPAPLALDFLDEYDSPRRNTGPSVYDATIKAFLDAGKSHGRMSIPKASRTKTIRGLQRAAHEVQRSASWTSEAETDTDIVGVLTLGAMRKRKAKDEAEPVSA